eukprot:CAMPEP_0185793888 /NCGR_PEP_ID=MMETSP1174-20130828/159719_1 /TAXON_ID=35687 /ORGANISM="Dictyocha speculum, Strain CCMP1381" /LENGTH=83 /DNA_ID=CAMNT_0028489077 /DNA_START=1393 /DNA_END=1644 /DNA_ORIENTATION=+
MVLNRSDRCRTSVPRRAHEDSDVTLPPLSEKIQKAADDHLAEVFERKSRTMEELSKVHTANFPEGDNATTLIMDFFVIRESRE